MNSPCPELVLDAAAPAALSLPGGDLLAAGDDLPQRFRILAYGPGTFTRNGRTCRYHFRPEHARQIVAHAEQKDEAIPVDCEHASFHLAEALATDEAAIAGTPLLGERAACGFVRLAAEADGLWARVERWSPRAALLLREKMYRYFSPVLRGLHDGRLRLTSLALTNTPALDGLEPLVAVGEPPAPPAPQPEEKGTRPMNELETHLAALLEVDELALDAESAPAAALDRLRDLRTELDELRALRARVAKLLATLAEPLALGAEPEVEVLAGRTLALLERAEQATAALSAVRDELEAERLAAATRERERLLAAGLDRGQLTPALVENWAAEQDTATLAAFLEHAPTLVPGEALPAVFRREDAVPPLPPELVAIAAGCGLVAGRVAEIHRRRRG